MSTSGMTTDFVLIRLIHKIIAKRVPSKIINPIQKCFMEKHGVITIIGRPKASMQK